MPSKAEKVRSKAFECHEHAMGVHDPEAKQMLEDLARLWGHLAEWVDKIAGAIPALPILSHGKPVGESAA